MTERITLTVLAALFALVALVAFAAHDYASAFLSGCLAAYVDHVRRGGKRW